MLEQYASVEFVSDQVDCILRLAELEIHNRELNRQAVVASAEWGLGLVRDVMMLRDLPCPPSDSFTEDVEVPAMSVENLAPYMMKVDRVVKHVEMEVVSYHHKTQTSMSKKTMSTFRRHVGPSPPTSRVTIKEAVIDEPPP